MGARWGRRRDDGGSMLAAVIVIVIGTGVCCFMVVMADSRHSDLLLGLLFGAAMVLLTGLLWLRYSRGSMSSSLGFWNAAARNHREEGLAAQYRPKKREDRRSTASAGGNKPITAEEARELKIESSRTWVPSKGRNKPK